MGRKLLDGNINNLFTNFNKTRPLTISPQCSRNYEKSGMELSREPQLFIQESVSLTFTFQFSPTDVGESIGQYYD